MSRQFIATTKCSAFHHPEFILWVDTEVPQADINILTSFLEDSVGKGTHYNEGDLIAIGSMLFRVARSNNSLSLQEPDLQSLPIKWKQGVTRSMQLLRLQHDIATSLGLQDELDPPSIRYSLLVGSDLTPQLEEFVLDRMEPADSDSGWFVGRQNSVLNYDDEGSLKRISVYQAIVNWPKIAGFLGLPAGCRVELSRSNLHFTRNGSPLDIKSGSLVNAFLRTSQ